MLAGDNVQSVGKGDMNLTSQVRGTQQPSLKTYKSPQCYACKGDHRLNACPAFQKMDAGKRLELVKQTRLCYNCLVGKNHRAMQCRQLSQCDISGCTGKHSRLLHDQLMGVHQQAGAESSQSSQPAVSNSGQGTESKAKVMSSMSCASGSGVPEVALPIVRVRVRGHGQEQYITTHALLDPGSNKTFCSKGLINELGIKGEFTTLNLETLNNDSSSDACVVSLDVTSVLGKVSSRKTVHLSHVYAIDSFPDFSDSVIPESEACAWEHLRDLNSHMTSASSDCAEVTLLIGQNVPQALVPLEVRHGSETEPYAVRTVLGWSISGTVRPGSDSPGTAIVNFVKAAPSSDFELLSQVERFWKLDFGPELTAGLSEMSVDDQRVTKLWDETTELIDNHYNMEIPFKEARPLLPDNRAVSERRLKGLGRRLRKNPDLHRRYHTEMMNLLDKGYAELASSNPVPGMTWYLPHHPVINPNKPEKLRIVFDCAAKYEGKSLNDYVSRGPDLTNSLLGVLLRIRLHPVATMSDIQAMFHQVVVIPGHRDAVRFLWWPDGNLDSSPVTYRMTVHLFGGVWSPSCAAYALKRTAEDNKDKFSASAVEAVRKSFYVDDCLHGEDSEETAVHTAGELRELLACGGFLLTKWASNSESVLSSVPEGDRLSSKKVLDLEKSVSCVERALGVLWDTDDDTLGIQIKIKVAPETRRGILSIMSSVYDPLGMVSPCVLLAKKLLQHEVRCGKGWDDELSPVVRDSWRIWLQDLPELESFKIPRCILTCEIPESVRAELHHFCDASQEAYGTVSYIRVVQDQGDVHCSFVMAKSRLAPIKAITIPRLELLAATLAVKVDTMLRREMKLSEVQSTFWTDSAIVLQYITNKTRRFQTFIANRVSAIHEGSEPCQWRHVPSEMNPADDATRGLKACDMVGRVRWSRGPDFLWQDPLTWPKNPEGVPDLLASDKEVKPDAVSCATLSVNSPCSFDLLLLKYSSWYRLTKAVAWLLKFKQWLLGRSQSAEVHRGIAVDDLRAAEVVIVRHVQRTGFGKELQDLASGRGVSKRSEIWRLEPKIGQDGLLRTGGRLQQAPVEDDVKHPILLPGNHHVATLVVRSAHARSGHAGREHVVATVRQRFWIPRCRTLVNKVLRDCVVCKKARGPLGVQMMADLPVDRVVPGQVPFSCIGIDCFGPFLVKRGHSQEKRYGCIFTCLAIRAVHIEKLHTLESDSFLNALMRFISRRGMPVKIRSDNGTNFTGGDRELRESVREWEKDQKIRGKLMSMHIVWEYNPPAASHMGGVWERQIRTVRNVLNVILRNEVLDDERLDTVFCEAEAIVNSRPLTAVSNDPKDLQPLTPNDLLLLRSKTVAPPGKFTKLDAYTRRWRHVQYLAEQFWKRWLREYLPTLQFRGKWQERKPNLVEGELVLVAGENTPRKCWPLGRITQVYPGKDGLVRSAEVMTAWSGTLVRPVAKLCPLGVSSE